MISNRATQPKPKELYRYTSKVTDEIECFAAYVSVELSLTRYIITKYTPQGYWIAPGWAYGDRRRWVSSSTRKRFAYPTKREALESFRQRKLSQISIVEYQLAHAKQALNIADNLLDKLS